MEANGSLTGLFLPSYALESAAFAPTLTDRPQHWAATPSLLWESIAALASARERYVAQHCRCNSPRLFHARWQSMLRTTHSFVLRDSFRNSAQLVVICPVYPAKLRDPITHLQACGVCRTSSHHAVNFGKGRFQRAGGGATCWALTCGGGGVAGSLLGESSVVGMEADLDARHEVLVVILQAYDPRTSCPNCPATLA
jgi:hypothetical protein